MSHIIKSFIGSDKDVASFEKRLSICIESNGFSFSVCSTDDKLLAIGEVECNINSPIAELISDIKNIFAEIKIQTFGLKDVRLIIPTDQMVWIPEHLFDETKKTEYLEALCKVHEGNGVFCNYNEAIKSYIVFSANNNQASAFKIAIPGLKVTCQHAAMVNDKILSYSDMRSVMLVNIREGESDFAIFCNKKLQLSNTFKCSCIEETLYHALNITKQLHLEDAAMEVALCGNIDRDGYSKMRPYFPKVSLYGGRDKKLSDTEMQHVGLYRYALILS